MDDHLRPLVRSGEDYQTMLLRTLARVAQVLGSADVRFALTGGCAVYARGGPPSEHDVDLLEGASTIVTVGECRLGIAGVKGSAGASPESRERVR